MAKLFKLTSGRGDTAWIQPESIIDIVNIRDSGTSKSEVRLRAAMVRSHYDIRSAEELGEQINDECYK